MRKHLTQLSFLIFCFAIIIPTIFGSRKADGWAEWVYDFQTLIAGTAAVVAAFVTVNQMIKSDERQDRRHRQIMSVEIRREFVTAERLYDHLTGTLFFPETFIRQYLVNRPKTAEGWIYEKRRGFYSAVEAAFRMGEALDDELVKNSSADLPSIVYAQIDYARARIVRLSEKVTLSEFATDGYDKSIMNPVGYDREVDFLLQELARAVGAILTAMENWQNSLKELYQD